MHAVCLDPIFPPPFSPLSLPPPTSLSYVSLAFIESLSAVCMCVNIRPSTGV